MAVETMKCWQADQFGKVKDVLKIKDAPIPEPNDGEARVKVILSSVGLPDKLIIEGSYPFVPNPPATPGQEFVGIVDKAGAGFPYPIGTKILGTSSFDKGHGSLAEYTICYRDSVLPFPDELTDAQAVAFPGTYHVAYVGLVNRAALKASETLLVLGAAGRTGSAALQLGKALGANVIAVIRNDEQKEFCIKQGADHVLNIADPYLTDKIMQITNLRGVDVIYDTVGGTPHKKVIQTIAYKGRLLLIGFAGGSWPELNPVHILFKGYAVMGALHVTRTEEEKLEGINTLAKLIKNHSINPSKAKLFSFDDAITALNEIGSSSSIGGAAVIVRILA